MWLGHQQTKTAQALEIGIMLLRVKPIVQSQWALFGQVVTISCSWRAMLPSAKKANRAMGGGPKFRSRRLQQPLFVATANGAHGVTDHARIGPVCTGFMRNEARLNLLVNRQAPEHFVGEKFAHHKRLVRDSYRIMSYNASTPMGRRIFFNRLK